MGYGRFSATAFDAARRSHLREIKQVTFDQPPTVPVRRFHAPAVSPGAGVSVRSMVGADALGALGGSR